MGSVYHYCSVETLKAILANSTIRLSDISKSNDSKEIDFLFDEYTKKANEKSNSFYQNTFAFFKNQQMENTVFLVCCFSKKKDNLHMWSCYGNKGVAIEFDEDELKNYLYKIKIGVSDEMLLESDGTISSSPLEIVDVEYYNSKSINKYFSNKNLNYEDDFGKIFKDSPKIKSDFFEEENEVRIIYTLIFNFDKLDENTLSLVDDNNKFKKRINLKSISTNDYGHKLVIDIPIDLKLIKSIVIGPNSSLTFKDLDELKIIYGLDFDNNKSNGSYR